MKTTIIATSIALLSMTVPTAVSHAQSAIPGVESKKDFYADSILIKMKDLDAHSRGKAAVQKRIDGVLLSKNPVLIGKTLKVSRKASRSFWLVEVSGNPSDADIKAIMKELTTGNYGVLKAEPNRIHSIFSFNDPAWEGIQKSRLNQSASSGYSNGLAGFFEKFANAGTGKIVSVVDTGKLAHDDVSSKIINEISLRSDFDTPQEKADSTAGAKQGCNPDQNPAIIHGLSMSSIAAATRNNNIGMVGSSNANLYSVRSLTTCNGSGTSDRIALGILWSAGLFMDGEDGFVASGFPRNDTPATVINLSLGSVQLPDDPDTCTADSFDGEVISEAIAAGSMVVAAAGNEYNQFYIDEPYAGQRVGQRLSYLATCPGVVSVGALDLNGGHAVYSNVPKTGERLVTSVVIGSGGSSDSTYEATKSNGYAFGVGTSQATALVSGVLASVIDVVGARRPSNTDMVNLISSTGSQFPASDSACGTNNCGTRLLVNSLVNAIDSSIDTSTDFRKTVTAASLNLSDFGRVVSFEDTEGSNEGLTASIIEGRQNLTITSTRAGRFFLRVGSSAFAAGTNKTELATAEVIINEQGDIAVVLANTVKSEATTSQLSADAKRVISVNNFQFISGNYVAMGSTPPYTIVDGRLVFEFEASTNGEFSFDMTYDTEETAPQGQRVQAVQSTPVFMTVQNGSPSNFRNSNAPQESESPATQASASAGGGGGGGSMNLFGLFGLFLALVAQKKFSQKHSK